MGAPFRKIPVVCILILLGWHSGYQAWMGWWHQLANESFAARFCENLDRPELECHGSCQLRRIQEEAPAPLPESVRVLPFFPEQSYLPAGTAWVRSELPQQRRRSPARRAEKLCTGFFPPVFHPPSLVFA